jgi:predicted acetyltransferase
MPNSFPHLRLVSPSLDLRAAYIDMLEESLPDRPERAGPFLEWAQKDYAGLVNRFQELENGIRLAEGRVPESQFWLVDEQGRLFGTIRVRHWLTPELEQVGGHIGYDIRPTERGKGYGTLQLRLGLEKAHALGLRRVLLTCDDDNLGSARVIEKNGGVLENRVISDEKGVLVRRYWIDLHD